MNGPKMGPFGSSKLLLRKLESVVDAKVNRMEFGSRMRRLGDMGRTIQERARAAKNPAELQIGGLTEESCHAVNPFSVIPTLSSPQKA